MDTPYSYQDSLHLLNNSEWSKLTIQDKAAVMQSFENETALRDGRSPCNISLFSKEPKEGMITAGKYNPANSDIAMNSYHLSGNVTGCLDTVLHEGRHAYQDKAIKGEIYHHNQKEVKAWRDNLKPGNYIDPEKNRRAYYRQPVEADAREYAAIASRQIQADQNIQTTNKGIASFRSKVSSSLNPKIDPKIAPKISDNKGIQSFRERDKSSGKGSVINRSSVKSENRGKSNVKTSGGQER